MKKLLLCFILTLALFNCDKDDETDPIETETEETDTTETEETETNICADNDLAKKVVVKAILKDCSGNNLVNARAVFYRKRSRSIYPTLYEEFQSVEINNSELNSEFVFIDDLDSFNSSTIRNTSYFIQFRDNQTLKVSAPIEVIVENGTVNLNTVSVCDDKELFFRDDPLSNHGGTVVKLTTQSEVDAFGKLGHVKVEGLLQIGEDGKEGCNDITNLKYLQYLNQCWELEVINNPLLISLEGMENIGLNYIDGSITIKNNPLLSNLEGLRDVSKYAVATGGSMKSVTIENNASLISLKGFNLKSYQGDASGRKGIEVEKVEIRNNIKLNSLEGLEGIEFIFTALVIIENPALVSLSGLENLVGVDGAQGADKSGLWIENNASLTNLIGLDSYTRWKIRVKNNSSLTNLKGLNNFDTGSITIQDNASLISLTGLDNLSIGGVSISNNALLTNLTGLENFFSGSVAITNNPKLESLSGLDILYSSFQIRIEDNPVLTNISSLQSLREVGSEIKIINNDSLTNLSGLENFTRWSYYEWDIATYSSIYRSVILEISDSEKLIDFCAINLSSVATDQYEKLKFTIKNNKYNPTVQNLIDGICSQ